jgi:mannose-6-phosphate isomerase-like protein (cupin superfamily)
LIRQFFTLSSLLEQAKASADHALRFHESTHWAAGVIRLTPGQHPVAPGDFWLVPAGVEHRFESFHQELVVFYVLAQP